jgi:hypothetical protein
MEERCVHTFRKATSCVLLEAIMLPLAKGVGSMVLGFV